jgi:Protease inhibitor Inh
MMRSVALLMALILTAMPGVAVAEGAVSDLAQNMVGGWEISDVDRERRCPLSFTVEPAPGGFKIDMDARCATAIPSLGAVVAWMFGPKDVLRLVDAKGRAVLEFTEVENGLFESERGAEGLLFLQTQAAVKVETRTAEQMVGDWNLLREADKPLCRLTLSNATGGADAYRVVIKPGCDKAIAAFNPSTWRLDRDQLILIGRGGNWRFSESDATVWERVPLSTDPLLLVRQ